MKLVQKPALCLPYTTPKVDLHSGEQTNSFYAHCNVHNMMSHFMRMF